MTKRKNIRLTLKPSDAEAFEAAKMKAENECGYTMRDGEFAARIVLQSVRRKAFDIDRMPKFDVEPELTERDMEFVNSVPITIKLRDPEQSAQSVIDVLNKEIEGGRVK